VHLFNRGAVGNTVEGNHIGLDANGLDALANGGNGVFVAEAATYSTIGPNNVIAYNGRCGVQVCQSGSLHNTITQNSIYQNQEQGISVEEGGNTELATPSITTFDLSAGTIEGTACANCTVEIFSDSNDEGAIYEGSTMADEAGVFAFSKGAAFVVPKLTATATDAEGNTGEFSAP
jgi:hypothetical protein